MKKRLLVLLSVLLFVLPVLGSCSQMQLEDAAQQYNSNYTVGIVKTTESKRSSYIEYYNEELELVNSIWYPYGGLWLNHFVPPAQKDGMLYLIPRGLIGQQNDRKVISLDLRTGTVREYVVEQPGLMSLAVDDRFIYAANNMNGVGHISRIDIDTGEASYVDLGWAVGDVFVRGGRLYAYWRESGQLSLDSIADDAEYISYFDEDLKPLYAINLNNGSLGSLACISAPVGNLFYVTLTHRADEESDVWIDDLFVCSTRSDGLRHIGECAHETRFLLPYQDKLITLNSDSSMRNNFIDIYDSQDGALLHSLPLDYIPMQGAIKGGLLYVQGFDCLVKYDINGSDVVEVKRLGIPRIGSPTDASSHYLSGIFLNE